jgi:hypothetical protein
LYYCNEFFKLHLWDNSLKKYLKNEKIKV